MKWHAQSATNRAHQSVIYSANVGTQDQHPCPNTCRMEMPVCTDTEQMFDRPGWLGRRESLDFSSLKPVLLRHILFTTSYTIGTYQQSLSSLFRYKYVFSASSQRIRRLGREKATLSLELERGLARSAFISTQPRLTIHIKTQSAASTYLFGDPTIWFAFTSLLTSLSHERIRSSPDGS